MRNPAARLTAAYRTGFAEGLTLGCLAGVVAVIIAALHWS